MLETISSLRCDDDEDLLVQCDVFEEELHADIEALEEMKSTSVNLNDHQSVFNAVNKRVCKIRPYRSNIASPTLNILNLSPEILAGC